MDNGYIVRFIRKDDRPVEEFFYHTFEDATSHLLLFRDDDSDLYARIEIIDGAPANNSIVENIFITPFSCFFS